jgi:hypothetical protein
MKKLGELVDVPGKSYHRLKTSSCMYFWAGYAERLHWNISKEGGWDTGVGRSSSM